MDILIDLILIKKIVLKETLLFAISIIIAYLLGTVINVEGIFGLVVRFFVFVLLALISCIATHFHINDFKWVVSRTKLFLRNKA